MDYTKKYIIIGFGLSGKSIYKYLQKHNANIIKVIDTRKDFDFAGVTIQVKSGDFNFNDISDADIIVLSPGVSIYHSALQIALSNEIEVIGDIEIFARNIKHYKTKLIGITGSNGKTTVSSLSEYVANNLGYRTMSLGNIGLPVLSALIDIEDGTINVPDIIVLELSSFQLETTYSLALDGASCLNISEDHLDRYKDLLDYAHAKARIFNYSKLQVLNKDDPICMAMKRSNQKISLFGHNAVYGLFSVNNNLVLRFPDYGDVDSTKFNLFGLHNYFNILAVVALLNSCGIPTTDKLFSILQEFNGLEHRVQKIATHKNVTYIDDSKGTNVGSVVAALSGSNQVVHLLLGGDGKGQDFMPLIFPIKARCSSVAIIGKDKNLIKQILDIAGIKSEIFDDFKSAVLFLCSNAQAGEVVLLSPACASWDMFVDYKDRAKKFKEIVYEYIQQK